VLVLVTAAGMDDIARLEGGAQAVEVGDRGPVPPDRGREVLTGQAGAGRRVPRVPEVGMPVQVHQAVAPRAAKRQPGGHQQAAVPADH
jgi:hypothetical protein